MKKAALLNMLGIKLLNKYSFTLSKEVLIKFVYDDRSGRYDFDSRIYLLIVPCKDSWQNTINAINASIVISFININKLFNFNYITLHINPLNRMYFCMYK